MAAGETHPVSNRPQTETIVPGGSIPFLAKRAPKPAGFRPLRAEEIRRSVAVTRLLNERDTSWRLHYFVPFCLTFLGYV
jgi:hypothetical protein